MSDIQQENLVILLGPTASGKTSFSLKLAKYINCEIISADSMQIYKGMDIGTDKLPEEKRKNPPHHMIDIISPEEEFSVAEYKSQARNKITEITQKNKLPIMVGGTGLYIKAVVENYLLPNLPDSNIRKVFYNYAEEWGRKRLYNYLVDIDPEYADRIHYNDLKRVSRALEIYFLTGKTRTFYEYLQEKQPAKYDHLKFGIWRTRDRLYKRINNRVEEMLDEGLIEEVKYLYNNFELSLTAKQALGYKELIKYFTEEISLEKAKILIKKRSRNLAKKQLSFFKRDSDIIWINPDYWNEHELTMHLASIVAKKYNLSSIHQLNNNAGI